MVCEPTAVRKTAYFIKYNVPLTARSYQSKTELNDRAGGIAPGGISCIPLLHMTHSPLICAAGNVVVPSYLALKSKGYVVEPMGPGQDDETWWAEQDGLRFQADNVIELLGLVTMYEIRGPNWQASDEEIDAFLQEGGN